MESTNKVVLSGSREVTINDNKVPIKVFNPSLPDDLVTKALNSRKFTDWLEKVNLKDHTFESIEIRDVFMFGPTVGFIMLNCKVLPTHVPEGHQLIPIPGYVFLRGDAVVILVIIIEKETNRRYVLLTDQYRLPFGDSIIECPAGMMDEEKHFKGQAALELKQEAGIEINPDDLRELLTFGPSLGGCDEKITTFYCEIYKTQEEIKDIESRLYGMHEEGELIRVKIVDFDIPKILSLNRVHASATLCSLFAYQNLVEGKL